MKTIITLLLIIATTFSNSAQNTQGLLYYSAEQSDGYYLFSPDFSTETFLINNCGEVVNTWSFNETPGLTVYPMRSGTILRAGKDTLQIRDWNNNLLWSYATTANGLLQHHDIQPLPTGNILLLCNDAYPLPQAIAMGRNPAITGNNWRLDKIVEIQPIGADSAAVVWEWKIADHLIQDFDPTKANFGVVADRPDRIDANYDNGYNVDWTHVNSVHYNATLDQIVLSVRHLNEVMIIDHSTTTAEAAGSTGGLAGKGGDILWRYGNPAVYRQGTSTDQVLGLQHDAKWAPQNLYDYTLSIFNNDYVAGLQSALELVKPLRSNYNYPIANGKFQTELATIAWKDSILDMPFYESKKSGYEIMPNGHLLVTMSGQAVMAEIRFSGNDPKVLWVYRNPVGQNNVVSPQGSAVGQFQSLFRGTYLSRNEVESWGVSITTQGILESSNPLSDACISSVGMGEMLADETRKLLRINPTSNGKIELVEGLEGSEFWLTDAQGRTVQYGQLKGTKLSAPNQSGIYFLQIFHGNKMHSTKVLVK